LLWSWCCHHFLCFSCPEGRVQQIMCRMRRGFPDLTLQLTPWAFIFCRTAFSQFAFLDQSLFRSCCCQRSLCFLLVPKDWFSSAHYYQFGLLSNSDLHRNIFTDVFFRVSLLNGLPCGNLLFRTRTCFDPDVATIFSACSCPEGLVRFCYFSTRSVNFPDSFLADGFVSASRPTGLFCTRLIQTRSCFVPLVAHRTSACSLPLKADFTFSSESVSGFLLPVGLSLFLYH
jgi:hypothetical protein